jgi:predicted tellurium resistance membrane protein TerC
VKRNRPRPVVITDAQQSQDDQLRLREIRYLIMMGIRVVCVIVAGVLVSLHVPLLALWLTLCVAGAVLLPWTAVILANDRLPKDEHRMRRHLRHGRETPRNAEIASTQAPRVIDVEP